MPHNTPEKRRAYLRAYNARPEVKARNLASVQTRNARRRARRRASPDKHPEKQRAYARALYHANAEQRRAKARQKYRDNREKILARSREPEIRRREIERRKVKRRASFVAEAGRSKPEFCEICGSNEEKIVFDHCHARGHFRGWLCDRCNLILGFAHDDGDLLLKLAAYLARTKQGSPRQLSLFGL